MPASAQSVEQLLRAFTRLLTEPRFWGPLIVVAAGASQRWYRKIRVRAKARSGSGWPTVSAVIDVVSVSAKTVVQDGVGFVASITYFYRNPELQTGDYRREFASKEEAKQWVSRFKGRSVFVHVDPRDPANSVLLDKDLAGLDIEKPFRPETPPTATPIQADGLSSDQVPQILSPGYRLLCGLAELASTAGLATCAVLLTISLATHGRHRPHTFYWICGAMLACSLLAGLVVYIHLMRSEQGRWLIKSNRRWAPAWMRWSLKVTAVLITFVLPALNLFREALQPYVGPMMKIFAPYAPYVLFGWIFLVSAAFQGAILRSQEEMSVQIAGP
jgi:hypothetical protein